MSYVITSGICLVAGAVFGVLFGRKNKKIADATASAANTVATKVESAVEKKSS